MQVVIQLTAQEHKMMNFGRSMQAVAVCAVLSLLTPTVTAQQREQATATTATTPKTHRLVLQVNSNDPATMNLALNNASNVEQNYRELGEKVEIEIVAFGPGLHMLRDDTSPVKERVKAIAGKSPAISFKACDNTRENMGKAEAKTIPLVAEATLVKSGVVRLMELQEKGWSYVRP
jgi:intracellular sulfur oxidation DsrE/DsrF family protein